MKKLVIWALVLFVQPAFANIAVECGTGLKETEDETTLETKEFMISADSDFVKNHEDGKTSPGVSGKQFSLTMADGREIKGVKMIREEDGDYVFAIGRNEGLGGFVGTRYEIKNPWGELTTTAEKKIIGGFSGGTRIQLSCLVFEI